MSAFFLFVSRSKANQRNGVPLLVRRLCCVPETTRSLMTTLEVSWNERAPRAEKKHAASLARALTRVFVGRFGGASLSLSLCWRAASPCCAWRRPALPQRKESASIATGSSSRKKNAKRESRCRRARSSRAGAVVKLYGNNTEREMYDNLADLYAIIKTTEAVEKALLRDAIGGDE